MLRTTHHERLVGIKNRADIRVDGLFSAFADDNAFVYCHLVERLANRISDIEDKRFFASIEEFLGNPLSRKF